MNTLTEDIARLKAELNERLVEARIGVTWIQTGGQVGVIRNALETTPKLIRGALKELEWLEVGE